MTSVTVLTARESRLRREARSQGLSIVKSRRRDPDAFDHGTYGLVNPDTRGVVWDVAGSCYGLSLDDLERELTKPGGWWSEGSADGV